MQKENLPIFAIFQTDPVKDLDAGILRIEYNSLNLHKIRCTRHKKQMNLFCSALGFHYLCRV